MSRTVFLKRMVWVVGLCLLPAGLSADIAPPRDAAASEKKAPPPARRPITDQSAAQPVADVPMTAESGLEPILLPKPPFQETLAKSDRKTSRLTLQQLSARANQITDDDVWFKRHGLEMPTFRVPNQFQNEPGDLPSWVPARFRESLLIQAIRQPDQMLLIYGPDYGTGRFLALADPKAGKIERVFDFEAWLMAPQNKPGDLDYVAQGVKWAARAGDILYVSNNHMTYAASSMGMNGYVTAIDLKENKVLWRSRPLVSNGQNFELVGDHLITGYGFTNEPDFVYVLNRWTGAVVQKLPVKSGPSYLLKKENRLYVRTYNTDYEFSVGDVKRAK